MADADSRLQKAPAGLLGLFDLKTLGENPNGFARTVVPVADVRMFYGANGQEVLETTAAPSLTGGTLLFTVPPTVTYRLLAVGGIVIAGAGAILASDIRQAVVIDKTFAVICAQQYSPTRGVTLTVNEEFYGGVWFNEPPLLLPGWRFGTRNMFSSSANLTQLCRAIVQPLPL